MLSGTVCGVDAVKQKFATLYELQTLKTETKKTLDKYLDMAAEQLSVSDENRDAFKNEVFETWYSACKNAYVELYSQHFSEAEVDQMLQYTESDLGKKLAQKQQAFTLTLMPVYQSLAQITIETAANLNIE